MKAIFLLFITISIYFKSFGQFSDTTQRMISFSTTGVINKTNDGRSQVLTNALRFGLKKKSLVMNTGASWIYGQQQSTLINNDFSSFLDFNLYKTFPGFYYWGLATFDKSYSLKINHRAQTGLGIAYNFFDSETAFLNVSDGILYETSDLKVNDTLNNRYETLRNSLRVKFRFVLRKNIVLESTNFWQPSLSDHEDYILRSTGSLSVKLLQWLSFTTALNYNKLNQTNRENLLLTFGFSMEKYF